MHSFNRPPTLPKSLELTALDLLFIEQFNAGDDTKKQEMVERTKFADIARISHHNMDFELFCNRPALDEHWKRIYCAYGLLLSNQLHLTPSPFYSQPHVKQFHFALGAYFFSLSQKTAIEMRSDFSYSEMEFINTALKFESVHAMQRYNHYLYLKIPSASELEKESLYKELIRNSKRMLPTYGSYGYMVLAEALGHYCAWLFETHQTEEAKKLHEEALKSLDYAASILDESTFSIANASLGRGLMWSNSWGIESPTVAKTFLEEKFQALCPQGAHVTSPGSMG